MVTKKNQSRSYLNHLVYTAWLIVMNGRQRNATNAQIWGKLNGQICDGSCISRDLGFGIWKISGSLIFVARIVQLSHNLLLYGWKHMRNTSPVLENVTVLIKIIYFCLSITVFQCYTDYWFAVTFRHTLRFTTSSGLASSLFSLPLPTYFRIFSSFSFYRRPGKYFLAPSVIWYTWYRSIPFEHIIFHGSLFTKLF